MALISIIAAIDDKRGLGRDGKLLWQIPEDLKRFKRITLGYAVIMGRKTFESIGQPLPERLNIIVTRDRNYQVADCMVCHSLSEAIHEAKSKDQKEIFIIGGGEIYQQAIGTADKLYLTLIKGDFGADTFFPDYSDFKKISYYKKHQNPSGMMYEFITLLKAPV